ncbi:MAG TPA: hypothetical protein VKE98_05405 [Gemmataceae bacterium]|nr:hypothetical protein [Gemmataceae bacterium]
MTKRKRLLLMFGCLAAVLFVGYVALLLTRPRHRITQENVEAIEIGMLEKEVEAILGGPAGDYSANRNGGQIFVFSANTDVKNLDIVDWPVTADDMVKKRGGKFWVADETGVWVHFDESGRVDDMMHGWVYIFTSEPFLAKLRRWLGM